MSFRTWAACGLGAIYSAIVMIGIAWADQVVVPCPGVAPLSPVQPKAIVSEDTTEGVTGYLFASAAANKTQASAIWAEAEHHTETGVAECTNEYWKVVLDPCEAATGGTATCKWRLKWHLQTTATLLKASALADPGSDQTQGYAHVKIFSEGGGSTSLSVNAYSYGDPESENKTNQPLNGPTDDAEKGIGEHISGNVQSFSKYMIDDAGEGHADAVFSDALVVVTYNALKSGTCGTAEE